MCHTAGSSRCGQSVGTSRKFPFCPHSTLAISRLTRLFPVVSTPSFGISEYKTSAVKGEVPNVVPSFGTGFGSHWGSSAAWGDAACGVPGGGYGPVSEKYSRRIPSSISSASVLYSFSSALLPKTCAAFTSNSTLGGCTDTDGAFARGGTRAFCGSKTGGGCANKPDGG